MRTITVAMMLVASNGLCQTPVKEADALQSLLVEVHQLRQDIEAMTMASQRAQITVYRLAVQEGIVARAEMGLDQARNKRSAAELSRERALAQVQMAETQLASGTLAETEAKDLQSRLPEWRSEVEAQTAESQTRQAAEVEAASRLKTEQAKFAELQDRLETLDKNLEKLGGASASAK